MECQHYPGFCLILAPDLKWTEYLLVLELFEIGEIYCYNNLKYIHKLVFNAYLTFKRFHLMSCLISVVLC